MGGYMADDRFLSTDEYVRAINESRVVINTQTSTRRDQIKGRIKEVLSCSSFLLEQDSPNARRFLEGSGVPLFTNAEEAARLALYYLDHAQEREAMAAQSRAWVLAHHSPDKYVNQILGALGL
jgi:spore maturation protein CgeB